LRGELVDMDVEVDTCEEEGNEDWDDDGSSCDEEGKVSSKADCWSDTDCWDDCDGAGVGSIEGGSEQGFDSWESWGISVP
jgi:hypothetical protein